jgi:hypothetical protein
MRAAAVMLAAATLVAYGGAQNPDTSNPDPRRPGEQKPDPKSCCDRPKDRPAREYEITIYAGAYKDLVSNCETPPSDPKKRYKRYDVLVAQDDKDQKRLPFSCVDGEIFRHERSHPKHEDTEVYLSRTLGDSVKWVSSVPFRVVSIATRPEALSGPPPFDPKTLAPPTEYALTHRTGAIIDAGADWKVYKVRFEIQGLGPIDPDIFCSP